MNMQNIQILFLLVDSLIALAPWRIVTKAAGRIGCAARENLGRSLGVIAAVGAVLYAFPPSSIVRAILRGGDLGGTMASQLRIGDPLVSIMLLGLYLGMLVWCGIWLWHRSLRALNPLWSGFCLTDH